MIDSKIINNTKFTDRMTSLETSRFNVDVILPHFDILDGLDANITES